MVQKRNFRWLKRASVLAAGALALSLVGCVTQHRYDQSVRDRFPAPGIMVSVESHGLHLHCTGDGEPVIVLESGLTGWSQDWSHVQPLLTTRTTVCSYDRAGYGWSDPSPAPNDIRDNVEDLRAALIASGHEPPFVLVGHSLGGLHAQAFARLHPGDVSAVVLVDSLEIGLMTSMVPTDERRYNGNIERLSSGSVLLSRVGLTRLFGVPVTLIADRHPSEDERRTAKALGLRTSAFLTFRDEVHRVPRWFDEVAALPPYPDVPTVVLSTNAVADFPPGFGSDEMRQYWIDSQLRLAEETGGTHRIFPEAGHYLQIEQADAVADAILTFIAAKAD
jgi:pimeloyl-ACP methyl ester carboxylesterase